MMTLIDKKCKVGNIGSIVDFEKLKSRHLCDEGNAKPCEEWSVAIMPWWSFTC